MKRNALIAVCGAILAFTMVSCNDATEDQQLFQADLTGAGEVPPRPTAANGAVGFAVSGNTVAYSIEVNGITSVTGAHIHSGAAGANGSIRIGLFPGPGTNFLPTGTSTGAITGVLIQGSFTASDVTGVSFDELLNQMRNGTAYANVHTTQFPGGEIRGQIRAVSK
jgi:hypothetical protein